MAKPPEQSQVPAFTEDVARWKWLLSFRPDLGTDLGLVREWLEELADINSKIEQWEDTHRAFVLRSGHDVGLDRAEVDAIATRSWRAMRGAGESGGKLRVAKLDPSKMRRQRWLWEGRIPEGTITLLGGKPGVGKSTVLLDLASSITKGKLRGDSLGTPRGIALVGGEMDFDVAVTPRLKADHADFDRVHVIDRTSGVIDIGVDLADLERAIIEHDIGLIVFDPLLSRLGNADSYKDQEVRTKLEPLAEMIARHRCSVVGIIHVTKAVGGDPLAALMGSQAFGAVARSALFAVHEPDSPPDKPRFLLGHVKCNVGAEQPTLAYVLNTKVVGEDPEDGEPIATAHTEWQGEVAVTIHEVLATEQAARRERARPSPATEAAGEWLKEVIGEAGGRVPQAEIAKLNKALEKSHSASALDRGLKAIGGRAVRDLSTFAGGSTWTWPALASLGGAE